MARPQEFDRPEVLRSAMGVFWRQGYEAASLADLLEATGLSRSSLYGAFGNKHGLLLEAFDAYRAARTHDMTLILSEGSAREAIEAFFRLIVNDARNPEAGSGCMSINQAVELAPHDPEIRRRVEDDFRTIEEALAIAIERGRAEGSVKGRGTPRDLAALFLLAFPGLQIMVRAELDPARPERGLSQLMSLLD